MATTTEPPAAKRARLAESAELSDVTPVKLSGGDAYPAQFISFCRDNADSFCDIVIRVEDKAFPAHRVVLAAASSCLSAQFNSGMKDATGTIELPDLSAESFKSILDYVYKGECIFTNKTLAELMHAADRLEVLREW